MREHTGMPSVKNRKSRLGRRESGTQCCSDEGLRLSSRESLGWSRTDCLFRVGLVEERELIFVFLYCSVIFLGIDENLSEATL